MSWINEFLAVILPMGVAAAITMVLMDRMARQKIANDIDIEILVLRESLKKISETHNSLMILNAQNREVIEDLQVKLSILQQGIPGAGKGGFSR